jgi:hypothetical protein
MSFCLGWLLVFEYLVFDSVKDLFEDSKSFLLRNNLEAFWGGKGSGLGS